MIGPHNSDQNGASSSATNSDAAPLCTSFAAPGPAPVPLRRLVRAHVEQAVKDILNVTATLAVPDERLFTFRSNVSSQVDESGAQGYVDFAEYVADRVSLTPCTAADCKGWLLDSIGRRLFRRPLDGTLRQRYSALYDAAVAREGTPAAGARWTLQAMLQSPSFLYLDEPVNAGGYLDGYAIAARLAHALWSSNPSDALLDAAARGELDTAEGVRSQAKAMLKDSRSQNGLSTFVAEWMDIERLRQTDARPDLAALGEPVLSAMEREPGQLLKLILDEGGSLGDLLTTSRTVPSAALTAFYGAEIVSNASTAVQLNPSRRAGLLTLPGIVASLSHAGATSPTLRGHAVLSNVLCRPPAPPPAGVNVTLPEVGPNATTRERLEAHFSSPACASCHRGMDGLGFAFENYDPVGRWRETENNRPIDNRGEFLVDAEAVQFHGAIELSELLADRTDVGNCFAKQWTRYATGIPESSEGICFVQGLAQKIHEPLGIESMIIELAASDYLRKGRTP